MTKVNLVLFKNEMLPSLQEQKEIGLNYINNIKSPDIKEIIIDNNDFDHTKYLLEKDANLILFYNSFVIAKNYTAILNALLYMLKNTNTVAFTSNGLLLTSNYSQPIKYLLELDAEVRSFSSKFGLLKIKKKGRKLGRPQENNNNNNYVLEEMLKHTDKIKELRKNKVSLQEIANTFDFKYGTFIRYFYENREKFE